MFIAYKIGQFFESPFCLPAYERALTVLPSTSAAPALPACLRAGALEAVRFGAGAANNQ